MATVKGKKIGAQKSKTASGCYVIHARPWYYHVNPESRYISVWKRTIRKIKDEDGGLRKEATFWFTYAYRVR